MIRARETLFICAVAGVAAALGIVAFIGAALLYVALIREFGGDGRATFAVWLVATLAIAAWLFVTRRAE